MIIINDASTYWDTVCNLGSRYFQISIYNIIPKQHIIDHNINISELIQISGRVAAISKYIIPYALHIKDTLPLEEICILTVACSIPTDTDRNNPDTAISNSKIHLETEFIKHLRVVISKSNLPKEFKTKIGD